MNLLDYVSASLDLAEREAIAKQKAEQTRLRGSAGTQVKMTVSERVSQGSLITIGKDGKVRSARPTETAVGVALQNGVPGTRIVVALNGVWE